MTNQEFIAKCNEKGESKKSKSPSFDEMAKRCGSVFGFTEKGISFLASLLSDQYTASGQLNEQGKEPDKSKVWSMPFLAEFNPEGHTCIDNHTMLRDFARQLSTEMNQYKPDLGIDRRENQKKSQFPSKEVIDEILQIRSSNGDEISRKLILEHIEDYIEDYYDEKEMVLPDNWETVTRANIKKWYP